MTIFTPKYKIEKEGPQVIPWQTYEQSKNQEYLNLISNERIAEIEIQSFLESNPSFIPGAFGLQAESGHFPHMNTVITQPKINGLITRKPDFLWLSTNSLEFTPVFIEIEVPHKKIFNKNNNVSADFTQALGQIQEWKTIMARPENIINFYQQYSVPDDMRLRKFKPIYCLIYGSRQEFEKDPLLIQKRAELCPSDVVLMSFDRLLANYKGRHLLCSTVKDGKYTVKNIPDTFQYSPVDAEYLPLFKSFKEAIKSNSLINKKRKEFLVSRHEYWVDFSKMEEQGLIITEWE